MNHEKMPKPRSVKGLLLEMKLSNDNEMKILAEETIVNMFADKDCALETANREINDLKSQSVKQQTIIEKLKEQRLTLVSDLYAFELIKKETIEEMDAELAEIMEDEK